MRAAIAACGSITRHRLSFELLGGAGRGSRPPAATSRAPPPARPPRRAADRRQAHCNMQNGARRLHAPNRRARELCRPSPRVQELAAFVEPCPAGPRHPAMAAASSVADQLRRSTLAREDLGTQTSVLIASQPTQRTDCSLSLSLSLIFFGCRAGRAKRHPSRLSLAPSSSL